MSKKKPSAAKAGKSARAQEAAQTEHRSNAAEEQRMQAKRDRAQAYLADKRKREAELTEKGYFF